MKHILITLMMLFTVTTGWGKILSDSTTVELRVSYQIGGTSPVGLPASIRHLNRYTPQFNPALQVDMQRPFNERWGLLIGLRIENKGMETDARVKNYHMEITRGGETLTGQFYGNVVTHVMEFMFTIPIQFTYSLGKRWQLRAGPYASLITSHEFTGWAYDGYLRVGSPTGPRVDMGSGKEERGDYDFSNEMRRLQYGIGAGIDWRCSRRMGVFVDLNWGLNGIFRSNFKTVEQTLYPIYGALGMTYRIK